MPLQSFLREEEKAEFQDVLDALDDPDAREILREVDEEMSVKEVSDTCDLALSTTYRKLQLLDDANFVDKNIRVRQDGKHTNVYKRDFDSVTIKLNDDDFEAIVSQPPELPGEELLSSVTEILANV